MAKNSDSRGAAGWPGPREVYPPPAVGSCVSAAGLMPLTFAILGLTPWSLWISTALMGVAFSVSPAGIWPSTAMLVDPRRIGTAFGLINVLQSLGMGALNLAAGWLNDRAGAGPHNPAGYAPMLWMFGLFALAGFFAVAALWRRESGPHGHGLNAPANPH